MQTYKSYIKIDSIVIYNLTHQKEKNDKLINYIYFLATNDLLLALHKSYFDQAKQKGLSIISNQVLREKISRLYEFDYPLLLKMDNDFKMYDYSELLFPVLIKYFEIDSVSIRQNKVIMSEEKYNLLLSNKNMHYMFYEAQIMVELLLDNYLNVKPKTIEIMDLIEKELKNLE